MTIEDMEKEVRSIAQTAIHNLTKHGELHPVLLLRKGTDITPMLLGMDDEADKRQLEVAIPAFIKQYKPDIAFMINDAWDKDPKNPDVRLGELIMIFAISYVGSLGCFVRYTRDSDGKPIIGETIISHEVKSRFFDGAFEFPECSDTVH